MADLEILRDQRGYRDVDASFSDEDLSTERRETEMKRNTRIGFGAFAVAILASVGCTDDFTDINTNPNAPTAVPVQYLLPAGIQDAVNDLLGTGFDRGTASTWAQHYAALQYTSTDRYDIGPTVGAGTWSGLLCCVLQGS